MRASIEYRGGTPRVIINGKPYFFSAYRSWRPTAENYEGFLRAGFPFITLLPTGLKNGLGLPYSEYGEYWLGEGVYDWDVLRRQMDLVVSAAPEAYVIMNIMLDTRDWFLKEHPECLYSFDYFTSIAGYEVWRRSAERMLLDTVDFLEKEYPERVFCIFISAGGTCEWRNRKLDMPPSRIRDEAYRKYVGREDARVPSEEELDHVTHGSFRDPVLDREAIDFLRYNNEIVTDTIEYFAKAVKRHTDSRLLVGVAAGYAVVGENPRSGHSAVADVVRIPEVDMIITPASYRHRTLDGVSASQAAQDSVRLHGKLIVTSIDNKSYASRTNVFAQAMHHVEHASMDETFSYVRREAALALSKGSGFWIFDMYGANYPEEWHKAELGRIREAAERVLAGKVEYNAEVAVLYDPRSYLYTNAGGVVTEENVMAELTELGRAGFPVEHYALDDILDPSFPKERFKLYILPNCFAPSEELRKKLRELRDGASMLFMGAAGAVFGERFSFENVKDLTGIEIGEHDGIDYFSAVSAEFNDIGYDRSYKQCSGRLMPSLKAIDGEAVPMGRSILDGAIKLAMKERKGGFDVWSARGALPESFLRELARRCGVFIYQNDGLPTYSNSRMVAIFDHKGGRHKLRFPAACRLQEIYSGKNYEYSEGELELDFVENELKLFVVE